MRPSAHPGQAGVQADHRVCGRPGERGSINILALGYFVIALLAAVVMMAVSSVYLDHKKLLSLADGASASAADTFDVAGIRDGAGPGAAVSLDDGRVQAASTEYLRRSPASAKLEGLHVIAASGSPDGRSATVTLRAVARPPIVSMFLPDGVVLEATSTARARLMR